MDYDQLFKATLTVQLAPFLRLFFPDEAAQLDLERARFVDKELFAAPPMGPGREVDLLADVPLRAAAPEGSATALVAIHIEVQSRREPDFVWRELEHYALLRRLHGIDVLPIALFPVVDVLGRARGRRPRGGFEIVTQNDSVLGRGILQFSFPAVTLRALDAATYLRQPEALAGALAAWMHRAPVVPVSQHKAACLRHIMEGSDVARDETRQLLLDVVEVALPLGPEDAEEFERLLDQPENQGIRQAMKTWSEQQQEIGEARGEARGAVRARQEDILGLLEARFGPVPADIVERVRRLTDEAQLRALLLRVARAATLADLGLAES